MKTIFSYDLIIFPILYAVSGELLESEKIEFCEYLVCDLAEEKKVCGIRLEGNQTIFKVFNNECELLRYGCQVDDEKAFDMINMKYCRQTTSTVFKDNSCDECPKDTEPRPVCGIRKEGEGYIIRIFDNECLLLKYNCELNLNFLTTDINICNNGLKIEPTNDTNETDVGNDKKRIKNIVIVDVPLEDKNNINETIDHFFAGTHLLDVPIQEMPPVNDYRRNMRVKYVGPLRVFRPIHIKPKNISEDYDHEPTLATCFHKCPKACPEIYAPVCGKPGTLAREPNLVFKNHCFMDKAQCKMRRENKSKTSASSAYEESTFIFCLGDQLYSRNRFLPLIKTLQRMGRLKLKGHFKYRLKNMRFFSNPRAKDPNIMG